MRNIPRTSRFCECYGQPPPKRFESGSCGVPPQGSLVCLEPPAAGDANQPSRPTLNTFPGRLATGIRPGPKGDVLRNIPRTSRFCEYYGQPPQKRFESGSCSVSPQGSLVCLEPPAAGDANQPSRPTPNTFPGRLATGIRPGPKGDVLGTKWSSFCQRYQMLDT